MAWSQIPYHVRTRKPSVFRYIQYRLMKSKQNQPINCKAQASSRSIFIFYYIFFTKIVDRVYKFLFNIIIPKTLPGNVAMICSQPEFIDIQTAELQETSPSLIPRNLFVQKRHYWSCFINHKSYQILQLTSYTADFYQIDL